MATPRKKNKIRDYDKTRQRMLEVVGEILRETGYSGLKTNNIARRLGKDKNLIRYYFNSLVNLEKAYIRENDYWFAFFESISLPEQPSENDVRQFFIKLMLENFEFFSDNIEMQKIILWQISENNPLMRSVSDQREAEGEKLLQMTDPYFAGTDTSFRAVIAVILGAIYYLVLHARTNRSTVCSLDINMANDRRVLAATIRQIIGWAWDQRRHEAPGLNLREKAIMKKLQNAAIDVTLLEILQLPFRSPKNEGNKGYTETYTSELEMFVSVPGATTDELLIRLISLNFNHSRFTAWCAQYWQQQTAHLSLEKAVEKLEGIKYLITGCETLTSATFDPRNQTIRHQLTAWIDEELVLLTLPLVANESRSLQAKLTAVQQACFTVNDKTVLKPIERMLEEMLSDIRKRL
jgi:AcrR family transcriptional regulator